MAEAISWITDFLAIELATIGTTVVTLGFMVAVSLVAGFALTVAKRAKGR
jgi:hypothetical protein